MMEGKITEEYKERKAVYVETILEMYCIFSLNSLQLSFFNLSKVGSFFRQILPVK